MSFKYFIVVAVAVANIYICKMLLAVKFNENGYFPTTISRDVAGIEGDARKLPEVSVNLEVICRT